MFLSLIGAWHAEVTLCPLRTSTFGNFFWCPLRTFGNISSGQAVRSAAFEQAFAMGAKVKTVANAKTTIEGSGNCADTTWVRQKAGGELDPNAIAHSDVHVPPMWWGDGQS